MHPRRCKLGCVIAVQSIGIQGETHDTGRRLQLEQKMTSRGNMCVDGLDCSRHIKGRLPRYICKSGGTACSSNYRTGTTVQSTSNCVNKVSSTIDRVDVSGGVLDLADGNDHKNSSQYLYGPWN